MDIVKKSCDKVDSDDVNHEAVDLPKRWLEYKKYQQTYEQAIVEKGSEAMRELYDEWHSTYDKDMIELSYNAPMLGAQYLHKYLPSDFKDVPILDVAAGTGLTAQILRDQYGYTVIDALDASAPMLELARKKGLYRNYICCMIVAGEKTDIPDDAYEAVVITGAVGGGHMPCDSLEELIRIVKPGGIFVHVTREEYTRTPNCQELLPLCQKLVDDEKWERLEETIPDIKFYMDRDALVQAYKVI